jgi:cyclase
MALAVRIIPTLLARGSKLVKGRRFSADRVVGHVQQAARVHQARGVDELCILDVAATPEGRGPDFAAIEALTVACFMPLTVGGGVRSVEDVEGLLRAGADKVCVKTAYWRRREFVSECAERWGSQAIVAALDVSGPYPDVVAVSADMAKRGAGEILLTSIDREGTMEGYDIELIRTVAKAVDIPVIAHGGCSGPKDMLEAINAGASAVAAGALFQFTDHTPRSCALWLSQHGVEVRL